MAKQRLLFYGDMTWAIYHIHRSLSIVWQDKYDIIFYDPCDSDNPRLLTELNACDRAIVQSYLIGILRPLTKDAPHLLSKMLFVIHGRVIDEEWGYYNQLPELYFSSISDAVIPPDTFKPKFMITPSGVFLDKFPRRIRSKPENGFFQLGWSGSLYHGTKRIEWSYQIANKTKLPVQLSISIPFEKMPQWFQGVDIHLITAGPGIDAETGPLTALQAVASGCLLLSTAVGNARHIPGPKFETAHECAEIIVQLQNTPGLYEMLCDEQYKYVAQNYTWEHVADQWSQAMDSMTII